MFKDIRSYLFLELIGANLTFQIIIRGRRGRFFYWNHRLISLNEDKRFTLKSKFYLLILGFYMHLKVGVN